MMDRDAYHTAIRQYLGDSAGLRFDTDLLDQALRHGLQQLSTHCPQVLRAVVNITEDTQDLSLASLTGFMQALDLFYPYEEGMLDPPRLRGCYQIWQNGVPLLHLRERQFEAGTTLQLFYAAQHQVSGLDSAQTGSLPPDNEAALVLGAAGFAAEMRAAMLLESFGSPNMDQEQLFQLSQRWQQRFDQMLRRMRLQNGLPFGPLPIHAWSFE